MQLKRGALMKNRSELRDIIIKVLYQVYLYQKSNINYDVDDIIKENMEFENEFVSSTVKNILSKDKELIALINKYLKDWTVDRLSVVDKAILLLGVYELMDTDTPAIVCINEAIVLAKKYSDPNVVKMINACLDGIYHNEVNEQ